MNGPRSLIWTSTLRPLSWDARTEWQRPVGSRHGAGVEITKLRRQIGGRLGRELRATVISRRTQDVLADVTAACCHVDRRAALLTREEMLMVELTPTIQFGRMF